MITITECHRNNLCVDCDDSRCGHAGDIGADCPKWRCDMPEYECEDCPWIREYVKRARRKDGDHHEG